MVDFTAVGKAIDIPVSEAGSIVAAVSLPALRLSRCYVWPKTEKAPAIMLLFDLLRGAAFFPFILLIVGAVFKVVLGTLIESNRVTLFLAGVIGAFSVFNADKLLVEHIKTQSPVDTNPVL